MSLKRHDNCGLLQRSAIETQNEELHKLEPLMLSFARLAGTHNVSEAFKRAGLQNKSTSGWLLHIPDQTTSMNSETVDQEANELLIGLGLSKTSESLEINLKERKTSEFRSMKPSMQAVLKHR